MARRPQPHYWKSKAGWYCKWQGKHWRLADERGDRDKAYEAFHKLMSGQAPDRAGSELLTVGQAVAEFLTWKSSRVASTTFKKYEGVLRPWADKHGHKPVTSLKPLDVDKFADERQWRSKNSVRTGVDVIAGCFNWCVEKKLIDSNPVKGCERPGWLSIGRKKLVTEEEYRRLDAVAVPALRELMEFLRHTGCRPKEAVTLEAVHFVEESRVIDLDRHKTAHKGKHRLIPLDDAALSLIQRLAQKHPTGPLFRDSEGGVWTAKRAGESFAWCRTRAKVREAVSLYSFRHTLSTALLTANVSASRVSSMMGNSVQTLERHYAHLDANHESNIQALNALMGGGEAVQDAPQTAKDACGTLIGPIGE